MMYIFVFGAPVYADEKHLGDLKRVVVNNGIANQFTVDPGLLGTERVVPISDVREVSDERIELSVSQDEWKTYPTFEMTRELETTDMTGSSGDLNRLAPKTDGSPGSVAVQQRTNVTEPTSTAETVSMNAVVLSHNTVVDDEQSQSQLHGLIVDSGRPLTLLLDNGREVPFAAVTLLDERRIRVASDAPNANVQPTED